MLPDRVRALVALLAVSFALLLAACEDGHSKFPARPELAATSEAVAIWTRASGTRAWVEVRNVDPASPISSVQARLPSPSGIDSLATSRGFVVWQDWPNRSTDPRHLRVFPIADVATRPAEVPAFSPWGEAQGPVVVTDYVLAGPWLAWIEPDATEGFSRIGLADLDRPGEPARDLGLFRVRREELALSESLLVWRDGERILALAAPFDDAEPEVIGDVATAPLTQTIALHAAGSLAAWAHEDEVYVFDASLPRVPSNNPRRMFGDRVRQVSRRAVLVSVRNQYYAWDALNPDEPLRSMTATGFWTRIPPTLAGDHVVWASCNNYTEPTIFDREIRCESVDPRVGVYAKAISEGPEDEGLITLARDLLSADEASGGPLGVAWISSYGDEEVIHYWNPSVDREPDVNPIAIEGGRWHQIGVRLVDEGLVFHGRNHQLHRVEAVWLLLASDPAR